MKSCPQSAGARLVGAAALILTAGLVVMALTTMLESHPGFYGTARAPHSDALTSWLHGALGFHFTGTSANTLLLRPSVAAAYASILTVTGDLGAIPVVFAVLAAAGLLVGAILADGAGRVAIAAVAAMVWLVPGLTVSPVAPDSLNTDFPAFACVLAGALLALIPAGPGVGGGKAGEAARLAGWTLLGIAAAVRGPLLAAAPLLLAITLIDARAVRGGWRPALAITAACALAFSAPVVADGALRAAIGVVGSQGLMAFYAFYADPTHTLTNDIYFQYMELKPTASRVLAEYLAFLVSDAGRAEIARATLTRLSSDAGFLVGLNILWVMMGAFVIGAGARLSRGGAWGWRGGIDGLVGMALIGLAAAMTGLVPAPISQGASLGIALVVVAVWGVITRRPAPAGLAVIHLCGVMFLVLTGTAGYDRVSFTFFSAAPLALIWAVGAVGWTGGGAEWNGTEWNGAGRWVAGLSAASVGILVIGLALIDPLAPSASRASWSAEVAGRSAAIKVSDDAVLDRSLYFSGRGEILYTRRDDRPLWSVRRYARFDNPNGAIGDPNALEGLRAYNALFHKPGAFVD